MTAKEYLKRLRKLEILIAARRKELEKLKQETTYLTGIRYDSIHVQTSKTETGFLGIEKISDMERTLNLLIMTLAKEQHKIIGQIGSLNNPVYVKILMARYVDHKSFETISDELRYSYNHILKLHGEALREFQKLI